MLTKKDMQEAAESGLFLRGLAVLGRKGTESPMVHKVLLDLHVFDPMLSKPWEPVYRWIVYDSSLVARGHSPFGVQSGPLNFFLHQDRYLELAPELQLTSDPVFLCEKRLQDPQVVSGFQSFASAGTIFTYHLGMLAEMLHIVSSHKPTSISVHLCRERVDAFMRGQHLAQGECSL